MPFFPLLRPLAIALSSLCAVGAFAGGGVSPSTASGSTQDHGPVRQLIIKFAPSSTAQAPQSQLQQLSKRYGVSLKSKQMLALGAQVFELSQSLSLAQSEALAADISRLPGIAYAEPDRVKKAFVLKQPNDPDFSKQWHYSDPVGGIGLPQAWAESLGKGVTVAVLDTGYRPHADLIKNIVPGYDFITALANAGDGDGRDADAQDPGDFGLHDGDIMFPSSWHGTHVGGTIAARTHNRLGGAGVAPLAKAMHVRVLGREGGYTSDIADAIVWASGGDVPGIPTLKHAAKVLNLSLGGDGPCESFLQDAIDSAVSRGAVVVVAAGNSARDAALVSPANCAHVVTVAASNRQGLLASYSNFGQTIEIAAPGGDHDPGDFGSDAGKVWSTYNNGFNEPGTDTYAAKMGTSMATPHVAGVVALMFSKNPSLSPAQVTSILQNSARPFAADCQGCGAGILDANEALRLTPKP